MTSNQSDEPRLRRVLAIWIDDETGELEIDDSEIAPWEACGIAEFLASYARDALTPDEEDD